MVNCTSINEVSCQHHTAVTIAVLEVHTVFATDNDADNFHCNSHPH